MGAGLSTSTRVNACAWHACSISLTRPYNVRELGSKRTSCSIVQRSTCRTHARPRQGSARTLAPSTNFNSAGKPLEHRIRMEVALRTFDEDGALRPGPTDERGSMLLAVRVPQDHVEPWTERCGQRSRKGAQPKEPLCCSRSRSLSCRCAGGPVRAQRNALGERAPRRRTGAVP